uniref:SGNH hydrolase-type esterase domain-containing protein n=1 Tax=Tetradesmus obliquus TaxID=3088 RepID=A0A383WNE5_TETOB|eukprot:jgi/Sobl393_1/10415/SZX78246.1
MCLQQFVDAAVDLVFVEYAANDGYSDGSVNNGAVAAFERLLRKLLQQQRGPAVVLMEFLATDAKQKGLPFYATAEDQYGVLAQYYGLPWLSYRNLVWQGLMQDTPGFSRFELFPPDEQRHPTPLGHRYMADIAVHLLQQTYIDSVLASLDEQTLQQHPLAKVAPPMLPGNYESSNLACIIGEDLRAAVVQQQGSWSWVNEGTPARPKWGFVSWQVGAALLLKFDTRASPAQQPVSSSSSSRGPSEEDHASAQRTATTRTATTTSSSSSSSSSTTPDMIIWLGYVKSWRHMGSATLSCISGCTCQPAVVDGLHGEGNTQQHMAKLFATQAEECIVEVKINPWTRSKDHKFKVTGVMVSRYVHYSGEGDFTDTVLLNTMEDNAAAAAAAAAALAPAPAQGP